MPAKTLYSLTMNRLILWGGDKRYRLISSVLAAFAAGFLLLVSCGKKSVVFTLDERKTVDSIVRSVRTPDSLARLQKRQEGEGNRLGSIVAIFEHNGQIDSAWVCYRKSMALNTDAGSNLGISLCHTYFGSLYEKAGLYEKATEEYETALTVQICPKA